MTYRSFAALVATLFFSVASFAQSERKPEVTFGYSNLQAQGLPDKNQSTGIFGSHSSIRVQHCMASTPE